MLLKFLQIGYRNFARNLKPPAPPPNLKQNKKNALDPVKDKQVFGEQGIGYNKKLKQKDLQLEKTIQQMIQNGLPTQKIMMFFGQNGEDTEFKQRNQKSKITKQIMEKKASQDLLINEIMKDKKSKQLPIGAKYNDKLQTDQQKQIKKQKILSAIRDKQDISKLNLQTISDEQMLENKYSRQIISRASQKKDNELKYFRQLIDKSDDYYEYPDKKNVLKRRLSKGQKYSQVIQKQLESKQLRKLQALQLKELEQYVEQQKISQKQDHQKNIHAPTFYENQDFYREKALREFQKIEANKIELSPQSKQIIDAGQEDLEAGLGIEQIMMHQIDDQKYDTQYKKQLYEASSFGKQDKKIQKLYDRMIEHGINIEIQQLKNMGKQWLFQDKKQRQQMQEYQKYLIKKDKKKKMDELLKSIHKQRLREDLNFEINFKSRFNSTQYDPLNVQQSLQKVRQANKQREALFVKKDKSSQIHYKKTQLNMKNFINAYFHQNFWTPNSPINQQIRINDLIFNQKKTVVNVFWKFKSQIDNLKKPTPQEIRKFHEILQKSANFISGKMTQLLGLRYGPDIRFHHERMLPESEEVIGELKKFKDQIIQAQIKSLKSKGFIADWKTERDYRKKLGFVAKQNLESYHNRQKLLTKKNLTQQKKLLGLKNSKQKTKKRKDKVSSVEKFWADND